MAKKPFASQVPPPNPEPTDGDEEAEDLLPTGGTALAKSVGTLCDQWETNRTKLDTKWQRNWDNYASISTDQWKRGEARGDRAGTSIKVTKSRVMMGYSLIIDLVLQGGEIPVEVELGKWQGVPVDSLDVGIRKELERRAKSVKTRIKGQLDAGHADRELSKALLSGAIFGEGFIKVVHRKFEESSWQVETPGEDDDPTGVTAIPSNMQVWKKVTDAQSGPALNWVPVWDIFRDIEDKDPRMGKGFIHRQPQSPYWLRTRKGRPYFDDAAITRVLRQHHGTSDPDSGLGTLSTLDNVSMSPSLRDLTHRTKTLIVHEFWGRMPREAVNAYEAEMAGAEHEIPTLAQQDEYEGDEVECHVMVCKDEVIRFARTRRTDRPLYRFVFEEGLEPDEATGIADNVEDLQVVTNGAFRAIEDNIRQACNVIWAIKEQYILNSAEIKKNGMQPGTVVWLKEGINSVTEIIQNLPFMDVTGPLVRLVQLCLQMLDSDSLIPRTQMGTGDPNRDTTAYEVSQQLANSSKYIGSVIRRIDETLIEPIIGYFYDYAMEDPDFPDKGNFIIKATGFQQYHDRLLVFDQLQRLSALWLSNPLMGVHANVRWIMEQTAKALDQNPEQAMVPEEVAAQVMQQMNTDPVKMATQNKAEADARKSQAEAMATMAGIKDQIERLKMDRAELAQKLRVQIADETDRRKPPKKRQKKTAKKTVA